MLERDELIMFFQDVLAKFYYTNEEAGAVATKFLANIDRDNDGKVTMEELYEFYRKS